MPVFGCRVVGRLGIAFDQERLHAVVLQFEGECEADRSASGDEHGNALDQLLRGVLFWGSAMCAALRVMVAPPSAPRLTAE
jgi:hypothetical protein